MHCNTVSFQELLAMILGIILRINADDLEHNAEKLQEILNRIMQRIMSIITSALPPGGGQVRLLTGNQVACDSNPGAWWWRDIFPFTYLVVSLQVGYLKAACKYKLLARLLVLHGQFFMSSLQFITCSVILKLKQ